MKALREPDVQILDIVYDAIDAQSKKLSHEFKIFAYLVL